MIVKILQVVKRNGMKYMKKIGFSAVAAVILGVTMASYVLAAGFPGSRTGSSLYGHGHGGDR